MEAYNDYLLIKRKEPVQHIADFQEVFAILQ